ncbi:ribosomal subunit interface protein [Candidatus Falkowbacteria bacterium HGW-Falkowbacteria-1]|jgi:ribosomal subunit interface protein|uniref:Ribosomal subunit interface protein n=1 Tax=Candidatus Falkowbacteria bacterium HGW-Falkowbacteria-1 TaxID=2013768 RepID=A0A2N2EAY2_9BACT|nr:MAG: ribosomal subunit interface protein [Candidatus Falkowbacteria bacterium HGW-Falkowbacteria-1]
MKVQIKTTKIELSGELKMYTEKKMGMLEKYLGDVPVSNCDVEIEHVLNKQSSGKVYRAETNLFLPGEILRVEKTEETIIKAIDKVKDHLVLMIKRYKEKKQDKKRRK